MVALPPPFWSTVIESVPTAVTWPPTTGRTTRTWLIVYDPSLAFVSPKTIWSPTLRSPTAMVWPPLVIVVELPTVIVRVQPSSVLSDRFEPSIVAIVMSPNRRA